MRSGIAIITGLWNRQLLSWNLRNRFATRRTAGYNNLSDSAGISTPSDVGDVILEGGRIRETADRRRSTSSENGGVGVWGVRVDRRNPCIAAERMPPQGGNPRPAAEG